MYAWIIKYYDKWENVVEAWNKFHINALNLMDFSFEKNIVYNRSYTKFEILIIEKILKKLKKKAIE